MINNILYIGASGFVGTRLIDITKQKYNIENLDKQESHFYPELTFFGDIRDIDSIEKTIQNKDLIVLLAAEHRDDVSPINLYYDVNVEGTRNVLQLMSKNGINNIIFTSSVAIYGLNKQNPDESSPADPFNHYGKSKWQAEELLREWYNEDTEQRSLTIIRPTVIFGERNRGNVYNLLKQIAQGKFLMVGNGKNKKSMAYVGNIASFIQYQLENLKKGKYKVFNYVDKPDLTMSELVSLVEKCISKKLPSIKIPYYIGMMAGYGFDILSKITVKKFSISYMRVKKFCATTQFDSSAAQNSGFIAPFKLEEALSRTINYEFIKNSNDGITYLSE